MKARRQLNKEHAGSRDIWLCYHINPLFLLPLLTDAFKESRRSAKAPKFPSLHIVKMYRVDDINDTQTGVPFRILRGARCVQRFDDSLNSAIHITYRISLRSSSMREPRDPLLKVIFYFSTNNIHMTGVREKMSTSV